MDRVIFGDNQFFGINHMSEAKAQAQAVRFKDVNAIIDAIDVAYECGLRGFMFSTHEQVVDLCEYFRGSAARYGGLTLYPVVPYAHKYANAVAEKGVLGAIKDAAAGGVLETIAKAGWAVATRDVVAVMRMLLDAEMKMFRGLSVGAVFLQNIVTDLLLGLGLGEVFAAYARHVRQCYGAEPGFITMNLPALVDCLLAAGVEDPIVCSPVNKIGYLMNPDRAACEETIRRRPFRPVAMSIFASGAVDPREGVEYVLRQRKVRSIVFGASTRPHIEQTLAMIEQGQETYDLV